jgi:DNA replication and repair protein RecF
MLLLIRDKQADEKTLEAWDEKISQIGYKLLQKRKDLFHQFKMLLMDVVRQYGGNIEFACEHNKQNFDGVKDLQKKLVSNRKNDIFLGRTNTGPHRESFEFYFNEKQLREYGSQGEHKLALLLIKLAEMELIQQKVKITPTLLLDDLFAKLDDKRSRKILDMLNNTVQLIITMTDLKDVKKRGLNLDNKHNKSFHLKQKWHA